MDDVDAIIAMFHHADDAVEVSARDLHAVQDFLLYGLISRYSFWHIYSLYFMVQIRVNQTAVLTFIPPIGI